MLNFISLNVPYVLRQNYRAVFKEVGVIAQGYKCKKLRGTQHIQRGTLLHYKLNSAASLAASPIS